MNFIGKFDIREEICELKICKLCLAHLGYKRYKDHRYDRGIYDTFALEEYFATYLRNQIRTLPLHTDDTAPLNEYGIGFREASQRYRAENRWRCENCRIDLSHPSCRKYLHTHHLNAEKYHDRKENHKALCVRCHAEEPMHEHLTKSPAYREFMKIYSGLLQATRGG
jgi:hypothetical protein